MGVNRRRIVLGFAILVFFAYVVQRGAQRGNDFKYPYLAAQAFRRTHHLHVEAQPRYPVSFHVMLAPLTLLPIGKAAAVWALLSFAAVGALPCVFAALSGIPPRRQWLAWLIVLPGLVDALALGQSDPINLFLVAAGLVTVQRGRPLRGVLLVGTAGMIKILPFLHLATVVSRCRRPSVWAGIALSIGLCFGVVASAVGWDAGVAAVRTQIGWICDREKPWHLVARGSDLRANNESLPIVLARTFGDLGSKQPVDTVSLSRLPLSAIWRAWEAILAIMAVAWLSCAWTARRVDGQRAWLGMFALTSILMLACTPICWHHYFLWLLPATLFLAHRPRLLTVAAAASIVGTAVPVAHGLGCHMFLALGLFALTAYDLRRIGTRGQDDPHCPDDSIFRPAWRGLSARRSQATPRLPLAAHR